MLKQLWSKVSSSSPAVVASSTTRSANVAKERLQLILAHERGSDALEGVNFPALQYELLQCLEKHLNVSSAAEINVAGIQRITPPSNNTQPVIVKHEGEFDIFEMQVLVKSTTTTR